MVLRIEFRHMMLFYGQRSRVDVLVPRDDGHVCLLKQEASGKKVELDGSLVEILKDGQPLTGRVVCDRGEYLVHMDEALGELLRNPVPRKDTLAWPLPADVTARFVLGGSATLEAFEARTPHYPGVPTELWTFDRPPAPAHKHKLTDRVLYSLRMDKGSRDRYEIRVTPPKGDPETFDLSEGMEFTTENRDLPKPDPGTFNVLEEFVGLYRLLDWHGTFSVSNVPLPRAEGLPETKPAPVPVAGSPTPGVPVCGSAFCGTDNKRWWWWR